MLRWYTRRQAGELKYGIGSEPQEEYQGPTHIQARSLVGGGRVILKSMGVPRGLRGVLEKGQMYTCTSSGGLGSSGAPG